MILYYLRVIAHRVLLTWIVHSNTKYLTNVLNPAKMVNAFLRNAYLNMNTSVTMVIFIGMIHAATESGRKSPANSVVVMVFAYPKINVMKTGIVLNGLVFMP